MSILTVHSAPMFRKAGPGRFRIANVLGTLVREYRVWKASRSVESMSEESLHDIGITRAEIDHAVRYGRPYRR